MPTLSAQKTSDYKKWVKKENMKILEEDDYIFESINVNPHLVVQENLRQQKMQKEMRRQQEEEEQKKQNLSMKEMLLQRKRTSKVKKKAKEEDDPIKRVTARGGYPGHNLVY